MIYVKGRIFNDQHILKVLPFCFPEDFHNDNVGIEVVYVDGRVETYNDTTVDDFNHAIKTMHIKTT